MRIAVYHNLPSGGAKRVLVEEVRRLSMRHEVTMFVPATADRTFGEGANRLPARVYPFEPFRGLPSPFGRINPVVRMWNAARLDALCRSVARDVAALGADVLLVHPCQFTQAPAVLRHARVPTVYFCHEVARQAYEVGTLARTPQRSGRRRLLDAVDPLPARERARLRRADRNHARAATMIACNSIQTVEDVRRAYDRPATLCRLAPPSEVAVASPRPRERFVLSVGALAPHKGFDVVVRALATLPPSRRPPLTVVSNYQDPAELAFLSALATECGVDATFHCGVSAERLSDLYARAGCLAYAPVREPFGLVVLEAMVAGAPVVGVAEGGLLDSVVPNVSGILCPREPEALGLAIARVLDDRVLADRLSTEARRRVAEEWTWEQHEACLARVLEAARARS